MYNDWFTIFGVTVHGYGVMIALGFLAAFLLSSLRAKGRGLSTDIITDLVLICLICGFAGGKLLYIIVEFDRFLQDPLQVLGSSGFVVYGGLILALLGAMVYCKRKKLNFLACFDVAAPAVALAQAFGRIGCFFAGCCYGRPTDAWFGITFPAGSLAPSGVSLIPTQLFSAGGDLLLAVLLLLIDHRRHKDGALGGLYLIGYGLGRFAIEFLRNDPRGNIAFLSTSQFVSLLFVPAGLYLLLRKTKTEKNDTKSA